MLDEPNANLDHEGEEALLRTLQGLKNDGVTIVIIAHRPSLLRGVDKMLVLREGMVDRFGAARRGHGAHYTQGTRMSELHEIKRIVRTGLRVIAGAVIAFAVWAFYAPLSGA